MILDKLLQNATRGRGLGYPTSCYGVTGARMAKRKTKPKAKTKRPRAPRPRTWSKDERGVPLTDNRRPFSLLPSDLLRAMAQPPGTPTKATHEIRGDRPTTAIPELKAIAYQEQASEKHNKHDAGAKVLISNHCRPLVVIAVWHPTGNNNTR
jgi:hypothetical protein